VAEEATELGSGFDVPQPGTHVIRTAEQFGTVGGESNAEYGICVRCRGCSIVAEAAIDALAGFRIPQLHEAIFCIVAAGGDPATVA
jgi:hypothetical protein